MNVLKHIFSGIAELPVYENLRSNNIVALLKEGEWMGVLHTADEGMMVLTRKGIGWIRDEKWTSSSARNLRVSYENGSLLYTAMA